MDTADVIDQVNALLKLGVGDSYRLEHIKQAYIQNKTIWVTDENYLKRMREKYLVKHNTEKSDEIIFENEPENPETIHCWKCGKKCPLGANFCMSCGSSIFEVGDNPLPISKPTSFPKFSQLKIPIIVGIPVLILIILGGAYYQGYFDSSFEKTTDIPEIVENEIISSGQTDSKCGPGTVYDSESNSCVLGTLQTTSSGQTDSKCGPGTVYDSESNSCILE